MNGPYNCPWHRSISPGQLTSSNAPGRNRSERRILARSIRISPRRGARSSCQLAGRRIAYYALFANGANAVVGERRISVRAGKTAWRSLTAAGAARVGRRQIVTKLISALQLSRRAITKRTRPVHSVAGPLRLSDASTGDSGSLLLLPIDTGNRPAGRRHPAGSAPNVVDMAPRIPCPPGVEGGDS